MSKEKFKKLIKASNAFLSNKKTTSAKRKQPANLKRRSHTSPRKSIAQMKISEHVEKIIELSNEFEQQLYDWAKESSSPAAAVEKIRRISSEFPDRYSATRDEVVTVALLHKELGDVERRIKKEAMSQWPTN